jgi:O-antigen/teichoic acid export membrane protein
MRDGGHVDTATLRGARIVGVICAIAFFAPIVLSLVFPAGFFYRPYHPIYERMIGAILLSLGLALLLALRDPARNAGVYAVIGLVTGSMAAAIVYALVLDGADPVHWVIQVPLLAAIAVTLVVTYTRLRRPHPIVVRIVATAVVLLPVGLYLYDAAYRGFVGR